MLKQHPFFHLFQKFITDSYKGRRLKKDGSRIKPQSIANYESAFKLIREFVAVKGFQLVIYQVKGNVLREHRFLKSYWRKFYAAFTAFIFKDRACFDNYAGQTIKQLRTFFNWLNEERGIPTGPYRNLFYVTKQEVPIITLSLQQLNFLISDDAFHNRLSLALRKVKDVFVFGCATGLRYSDLRQLKSYHVFVRDEASYLTVRSQKTCTETLVKLPAFAVAVVKKYRKSAKNLLPMLSLNQFNASLKKIGRMAGWTQRVARFRTIRGVVVSQQKAATARFCDCLGSHTMRRTCITLMLGNGVSEHSVRKISGHIGGSKSFYRYVNFVQSLFDKDIDQMHLQFGPGINRE